MAYHLRNSPKAPWWNLTSNILNGFVQAQFKYNKIDFFAAAIISNTVHQREGYYKNGKFASNRFTPTIAGTYFISLGVTCESDSAGIMNLVYTSIYKNGSALAGVTGRVDFRGNPGRGAGVFATVIVTLDSDDYIEGYAHVNAARGAASIFSYGTSMSGFKLI